MADSEISRGSTQIPYQEQTFTLAAGAFIDVFQIFNYFRILSATSNSLSIQVGQNGLVTPFTGTGIGLNFSETFDRIRIINTSGGSNTIVIAIADGDVTDDRLTVSATLNVQSTTAAPVINVATTGAAVNSQISVTTTATQIAASNSIRGAITIRNHSATDMFIGFSAAVTTANGLLIKAGEFFSSTTRGAIFGIVAATTVTVGVWDEAR